MKGTGRQRSMSAIQYFVVPDCDEFHIEPAGDFMYSFFKRIFGINSETVSSPPGWSGNL
jgi:hypothetical protein